VDTDQESLVHVLIRVPFLAVQNFVTVLAIVFALSTTVETEPVSV
jgi:hypothetical protein